MGDSLPIGWDRVKFGDIATFSGGSAFSEEHQGWTAGEIPFIKVSDMNIPGNETFITRSNNWVTRSICKNIGARIFNPNTTIFAKVGAALLLNRRRILTMDTAIDNNLMAAIPISAEPLYLYYLLQNIDLGKIVQEGAVPSVNQSQLQNICVVTPPLPEQKKIATILTSVDTAIEKTQAQIDKLNDLKTGMMQELLTKGIGPDGKPHTEFKDSPVGRIPVEWEVRTAEEVCTNIVDCVNKTAPTVDYATPYRMIRTSNIREGKINTKDLRFVDKETFKQWSRRITLEDGDLIFTREAPVGEVGILKNSKGYFLGQRTMMYRVDTTKLDNYFFLHSLQSEHCKNQFADLSGGSTVAHLRVPDCEKILLPIPPILEQKKISRCLNEIEDKGVSTSAKLSTLKNLKKALMQDLLTGKVRVTPDPE